MAEIIYKYHAANITIDRTLDIRWLSTNDYDSFIYHLKLCGRNPIDEKTWTSIYDQNIVYCGIFINDMMVARACVEKYSDMCWEIADVRVVKDYRNKGYATQICLFVLNYIISNWKSATIRTEEDNDCMQRVISHLGFLPI